MVYETLRQMVHLGGLVFVLIAQLIGSAAASLIFFIIAAAFLIYSRYVRREGLPGGLGYRLRSAAFILERDVGKPFLGAFWFYFALGLAFLVFPMNIATASGLILSVGDSLSTIVGIRYGKRKILGRKSLWGSVVFFLSGFLVTVVFLGSLVAFLGSISATFAELVPELERIRKWENRELVDDNWLIPLLSGLIMCAAGALAGGV
jgi:dolichol kinase